jgi:hypothetical protein
MLSLRRRAVWAWPAVLVAGLGLILVFRLVDGPSGSSAASPAGGSSGVVAGEPSDLAAAARRIRLLQAQVSQTRDQLAALQTQARNIRQQIITLDEMLAGDSLTDSPGFLRDDTSVRALQKIIREAASSPATSDEPDRLGTAAVVARERLRSKLESLREQLTHETAALDAQSGALRQRLRLQSDEVEHLQRQVQKELKSSALPPPTSGTETDLASGQ